MVFTVRWQAWPHLHNRNGRKILHNAVYIVLLFHPYDAGRELIPHWCEESDPAVLFHVDIQSADLIGICIVIIGKE